MLRKVSFEGAFAEKYGAEHELDFNSIPELLTAMEQRHEGFRNAFYKGEFNIPIYDGKQWFELKGEQIACVFSEQLTHIKIIPVIKGESDLESPGAIQGALAIALFAAGIATGGTTSALGAQLLVAGGTQLAMGITAYLLAPDLSDSLGADSSMYTGQKQIGKQGTPKPRLYGRAMSNLAPISFNLDIADKSLEGEENDSSYWATASTSRVATVGLYSSGPVQGFTAPGQTKSATDIADNIFIGDTPLSSYTNYMVDARQGYGIQTRLRGFETYGTPKTGSGSLPTGEITIASPFTRTIDNNIESVKINLTWPEGLYRTDGGKTKTSSTCFGIFRRVEGETTWQRVEFINDGVIFLADDLTTNNDEVQTGSPQHSFVQGLSTTGFEKQYTVPAPSNIGNNKWEFKVTLQRAGPGKSSFIVSSYIETIAADPTNYLTYPDNALVGIDMSTESGGSDIIKAKVLPYGALVKVPDYTSGVWNGTFKTIMEWSDNPAWVLYDMLTEEKNGGGINEALIDKYSFFDAAQYCEANNITFNQQIYTEEPLYTVAQKVAATMRAKFVGIAGLISVFQDRPYNAVASVGVNEVIDGNFAYTYTDIESRINHVTITFNNPEDDYNLDTVVREDATSQSKYGLRRQSEPLFGCTDKNMAAAHAEWLIRTKNDETRRCSWVASFGALEYNIGDVVTVYANNRPAQNFRISKISEGSKKGQFNVESFEYGGTKYAQITSIPAITTTTNNTARVGVPGPVTSITVKETTNATKPAVRVEGVQPSVNANYINHYIIRWVHESGVVGQSPILNNPWHEFTDFTTGQYTITIDVYNINHVKPAVATSVTFDIDDVTTTESGLFAPINLRVPGTLNDNETVRGTFYTKDLTVKWDAHANNIDNPNFVLDHYEVECYATNTNPQVLMKTYKIVPESSNSGSNIATLLYADNDASLSQGEGSNGPQRNVNVVVRAVDTFGRKSDKVEKVFSNYRPAALTGQQFDSDFLNTVSFSFNPSPDKDLDRYKVRMSTSSNMSGATVIWEGTATHGTVNGFTAAANLYFQAGACDRFDTDDINWGSIEAINTIDAVMNTGYTFSGFRVYEDDNNDLVLVGNSIAYKGPDGTVTEFNFDNVPDVSSGVWKETSFDKTTRYWYYFDRTDGANGRVKKTTTFSNVFEADGSHALMFVTEDGAISHGRYFGGPIQHQDQLYSRIIGAEHFRAEVIFADEGIFENGVFGTAKFRNGSLSDIGQMTLSGPVNTTLQYNMRYLCENYTSTISDKWQTISGAQTFTHSPDVADVDLFPYWVYEVPETGDSEPVTVMLRWQGNIGFETTGTLSSLRLVSAMHFEYASSISPVQFPGFQWLQPISSVSRAAINLTLKKDLDWYDTHASVMFPVQTYGGHQLRVRYEAFPFNMNSSTYYNNFKRIDFRSGEMIATAILR